MPAINILNVGYNSTNYYLLTTTKSKLLVDVGWPETLPKMVHSLQRYQLQLKDIPYMLATHFHPDHAGLVQDAKQQGVKLVLMENQLAFLTELNQSKQPQNHYIEITLNDNLNLRPSESRDFLARLGIAGEIIATPGHSDDSVTLILDEGLAFTGDLHLPEFATAEQMERTTASWAKIRRFHVHTIYPAHGPIRPLR
jgi:endoribonuclease LACTB2